MHEANFSPLALRESILVVPLGGPPSDDTVRLVLDFGREGIDTTLADPIAIPAAAWDRQRAQYRAELLIARIGELDGRRLLGVTGRDVYARDLAFAFGLAECPGRAAVISLFRLRLAPDAATFRARVLKEAVHELGHTLGLAHCPNRRCVMHFSAALRATDRKSARLCSLCSERTKWVDRTRARPRLVLTP